MVLVVGKHRFDVSRTLAFCGRHRLALMLVAMLLVLSMSASVCAMQNGGTLTARPVAEPAASNLSGGWCPRPPHRDLNYRSRYNYAAFNSCDWFMTFQFTNVREFMTEPHRDLNYRSRYNYAAFNSCDWFMTFQFTNVREFMTEPQRAAVDAWVDWFARTRDGFVRFPAYKRLWSRGEIGQPI